MGFFTDNEYTIRIAQLEEKIKELQSTIIDKDLKLTKAETKAATLEEQVKFADGVAIETLKALNNCKAIADTSDLQSDYIKLKEDYTKLKEKYNLAKSLINQQNKKISSIEMTVCDKASREE